MLPESVEAKEETGETNPEKKVVLFNEEENEEKDGFILGFMKNKIKESQEKKGKME